MNCEPRLSSTGTPSVSREYRLQRRGPGRAQPPRTCFRLQLRGHERGSASARLLPSRVRSGSAGDLLGVPDRTASPATAPSGRAARSQSCHALFAEVARRFPTGEHPQNPRQTVLGLGPVEAVQEPGCKRWQSPPGSQSGHCEEARERRHEHIGRRAPGGVPGDLLGACIRCPPGPHHGASRAPRRAPGRSYIRCDAAWPSCEHGGGAWALRCP